MEEETLISVVLPTFNREKLIARSISSILNQTYKNFELIVVDDGSTDNTEQVVRAIHDPRIIYIKNEHRGGAAARNTGIQAARGAYIAFQDSDDEWFPSKLEKQLDVFMSAANTIGVVYTGFWKLMKDGKKVYFPPENIKQKEGDLYAELLWGNFITNQAAMVRKECFERVGGYDESLPGMHEWDLWLRMATRYEFAYIAEPLVQTYFTQDSITAHSEWRLQGREIIFGKHREEFKKYPDIFALHTYTIGNARALRGDMTQARKYLRTALFARPTHIKYLAAYVLSLLHSKKIYKLFASHGHHIV